MAENLVNGNTLRNAKEGKTAQESRPTRRAQTVQRAPMAAGGILSAVLLLLAVVTPLHAQSYPNKPIRFIVPFPPGGGTDIVARIIGPKLSERLGQPVVIENRAGAGGNVGSEFIAKSRPDGYTIGIVTVDMTPGPNLYKKLGYDPVKDFAPISLVAQSPLMMIVRPSLPAKTLKEFIEYAKANPGKVNYGSSGMGGLGHLAGELLKSLAKINIVHAPYKGAGPAMIALVGGEVDMIVVAPTSAVPQIEAGKARGLAALGPERAPSLPDVPTSKEAGLEAFVALYWNGVLAPAGTPRDIINRLNAEVIKIAAMPDTMEQIRKAGLDPHRGTTPEQFGEFIKAEIAGWGKVIKEANIPMLD